MRTMTIVTMLFLLSACKHLTPYESDFSCKNPVRGECIPTTEAYEKSIADIDEEDKAADISSAEDLEFSAALGLSKMEPTPEVTYYNALIKEMTGILEEPKTPMVKPPKILRILVFPYEGDGDALYMPRYIYLMVDRPKWILGNHLNGGSKERYSNELFQFP